MLTSVVQERRVALVLVSASTCSPSAHNVSGAPVRVMLAWRNASRCAQERSYLSSLCLWATARSAGPDAVTKYSEIFDHCAK